MGTVGLELRQVRSDFEHVWYMADKTRLAGDHETSYHLWAVVASIYHKGTAHLHLAAGLAHSHRYVEALQIYSKLITCAHLTRDNEESDAGESNMYDDIAADEDSDAELRVLCRGTTEILPEVVADATRHRATLFKFLQERCMYEDRDSWHGAAGGGSLPSVGKRLAEEGTAEEADDRRGCDPANGPDAGSDGEGSIVDDASAVGDESASVQTAQVSETAAVAVPEYSEIPVCDGLDGLGSSSELAMAMEWPTAPIRARIGLHDPKRIQDMQEMPTANGGGDSLRVAMGRPSYRAGFGATGKVGTQRAAWRAEAVAQAEATQHTQQRWMQTLVFGGAVAMVVVAMRRRKSATRPRFKRL
jgi:hypothetical protein